MKKYFFLYYCKFFFLIPWIFVHTRHWLQKYLQPGDHWRCCFCTCQAWYKNRRRKVGKLSLKVAMTHTEACLCLCPFLDSYVSLFWTCLTFLLRQGFLCCLRKPTMNSVREHTDHHCDRHAKFAAISRTFNCCFQCEQIHFPPHDLLGYKRLILSGQVTWMLLHLFAVVFSCYSWFI